MKYLCLAYEEERNLNSLTQSEWDLLRKETLDYVDDLKTKGYLITAERLQSVKTAATVRVRSGKATVTDGPCRNEGDARRILPHQCTGSKRSNSGCLKVAFCPVWQHRSTSHRRRTSDPGTLQIER